MGAVAAQLVELARPALAPGEEVLATTLVNYNGTVQPNNLTVKAGLAGLAPQVVEAEAPDPLTLVVFPSARQMGLALTGGRILVWALGFSGKPKSYLGPVDLAALQSVRVTEVRAGALLTIEMRSGASVDLETMAKEPADDFVANLLSLVHGDDAAASEPAPAGEDVAPPAEGWPPTPEDAVPPPPSGYEAPPSPEAWAPPPPPPPPT